MRDNINCVSKEKQCGTYRTQCLQSGTCLALTINENSNSIIAGIFGSGTVTQTLLPLMQRYPGKLLKNINQKFKKTGKLFGEEEKAK